MADTPSSADNQGAYPQRASRARNWFNRLKLGGAVIVVLALIVGIGRWLYHQHTHVSADDARVVSNEITVSSRLAGRITGFSLAMGDRLAEGDTVAHLYKKPDELMLEKLQAKVKGAEAQLAFERQQLDLATRQLAGGIEGTSGRLQADLAAADAARAAMQKARKTWERSQRLFASGTVSPQKKEDDYYTYQAAKAEYERARHQVAVDRSNLGNARAGMLDGPDMTVPNPDLLRAQLAVTRQNLAQDKADLKRQQVQVEDSTVLSPIDGVVDKTFVDQGEYVSPGQPLIMMHAPRNVWVQARIKETEVGKLKPGQQVAIAVDAYPDLHFSGHVEMIGHAATSEFALLPNPNPSGNFTKITQRIPVRILIDKGPRELLSPGMMVVVDIDISGDNAGH